MTSPFTHDATEAHFEANAYFGLNSEDVTFFQQGWLPCFTEEGKIIMRTKCDVATAPDGNGGLYKALHEEGCLAGTCDAAASSTCTRTAWITPS